MNLDLPKFIRQYVTGREESLFSTDMQRFDTVLSDRIDGRSVLVIGGAGSIGSAFIKALLNFRPARLFVVDTNENALTELVRDLRSSLGYNIPESFLTYPMDFGDPVFEKILRQKGPFEIVANFAAHKHVRSEKDSYAIEAMLNNNVLKAGRLLELLSRNRPERFFCVSTDKAANPVNVMGASKKMMETLITAYSEALHASTARFANVAFSNGSLPAGFLERIMKRQALSAPRDVERYFVSPEEAGQLCLLACMLGASGEIFFPKLDAAINQKRFSTIATDLLHVLGFQADICSGEQEAKEKARELGEHSVSWPVYFFDSDTSGEKASEEFFTSEELPDMERFHAIGVIRPDKTGISLPAVSAMTRQLQALLQVEQLPKAAIVEAMQQLIPGFRHLETGQGLDQKM